MIQLRSLILNSSQFLKNKEVKTFKQFIFELTKTEIQTAIGAEQNLLHSVNRPGHQAPGYNYGGRLAPDRNDPTKQVPEQQRAVQDLKAAQQRSQQRQQP